MASKLRPNGYWKIAENRINAVRAMVAKTNKTPEEITIKDFYKNKILTVLTYYKNSPVAALQDAGYAVSKIRRSWKTLEERINAIKEVVTKTGKKPNQLNKSDFTKYGLDGLLHFYSSIYDALKKAGLADFEPWEMEISVPPNYWKKSENRLRAIRWFVAKIGKPPKTITRHDFANFHLGGVLHHHGNSSYLALKAAGFVNFKRWEMGDAVPSSYWRNKDNVLEAIKWLCKKTKKSPKDLIGEDFENHRMSAILSNRNSSTYAVLNEAGLIKCAPWELKGGVPKGYWTERDNRIMAIKWLITKTGKAPKEIDISDFHKNNLVGILSGYYENYPYLALKDAGLADFEPWGAGHKVSKGYWEEKNNRVRAVKWLVAKIGTLELTSKDFIKNGLGRIFRVNYESQVYMALQEAGYDVNEKPKPMMPAELLKLYIKK